MENGRRQARNAALIVVGIAMNLGLGFLVAALKLPFYLDSIGTVLVAALGGLLPGLLCGLATVILGSVYTPTLWAYAGTALVIAAFTRVAIRWGYLERLIPTVFLGLLLGVVTAMVSAPVTALVWGGVSLAGTDFLTAWLLASGRALLDSVLLAGLATDPIDKLVTSLVAFAIVRSLPDRVQSKA